MFILYAVRNCMNPTMLKNGWVMVDQAQVVKTDIQTSNGVIHVIDSVIIPRKG